MNISYSETDFTQEKKEEWMIICKRLTPPHDHLQGIEAENKLSLLMDWAHWLVGVIKQETIFLGKSPKSISKLKFRLRKA